MELERLLQRDAAVYHQFAEDSARLQRSLDTARQRHAHDLDVAQSELAAARSQGEQQRASRHRRHRRRGPARASVLGVAAGHACDRGHRLWKRE